MNIIEPFFFVTSCKAPVDKCSFSLGLKTIICMCMYSIMYVFLFDFVCMSGLLSV